MAVPASKREQELARMREERRAARLEMRRARARRQRMAVVGVGLVALTAVLLGQGLAGWSGGGC